jgi:cell division protein FtsW
MAPKLKSDRMLFLATFLLVCTSILMVYSASAVSAVELFGQEYLFVVKQLMWGTLGIALMGIVMRVDYGVYREPVFLWACLAVVGVALVAVLFSEPVNNARRWFSIGGFGIQPSEPAKLAAIFFTAAVLERRMHRINELGYAILPIFIVVSILLVLILLEPDFGTAASLVLIAAVMVFAAGLNYAYVAGAVLVALPVVAGLVMSADYRRRRVLSFLDPWEDPLGSGYHVIQSLYAVATGGVFGRGFTQGVQKLFYLPEAHTDFIYSVISEELGLIGATLIVLCFLVIAWRGLRATLLAPDRFGAFLALGVTTMVVAQAFVHISVTLGLLPPKGIPLPFVSYGGSSLLVNMVGMGVLLNVSQHASEA